MKLRTKNNHIQPRHTIYWDNGDIIQLTTEKVKELRDYFWKN